MAFPVYPTQDGHAKPKFHKAPLWNRNGYIYLPELNIKSAFDQF